MSKRIRLTKFFTKTLTRFKSFSNNKRNKEDVAPLEAGTLIHKNAISSKEGEDHFDYSTWVSATQTRNYLLRDPVCDYFKYCDKDKDRQYRGSGSQKGFIPQIMQRGNEFEDYVMNKLYKKIHRVDIVDLGGDKAASSLHKFNETIQAMKKGVGVIYQGVLRDYDLQTYGAPDLIVRSDFLKKIVKNSPVRDMEEWNGSKIDGKNCNYHYVIVDIKFTTLYMRSNGKHLLNKGSVPAYKGQLWIYNEALRKIQGYNPCKTYILGRAWRYISKGSVHKNNSPFDRLGCIDYKRVDKKYVEQTKKAIDWVKLVKSPESKKWDLTSAPLPRPELYPNMSNSHDYPYHRKKVELADRINELTKVWMVGPNARVLAHEKGIYAYNERDCTADVLGFKRGGKRRKVVQEILNINYRDSPKDVLISPSEIETVLPDDNIEFFVDFETINDVFSDFEGVKEYEGSLIFSIGIGYIEPETRRWVYKDFTTDRLNLAEEERICREFMKYIYDESSFYGVDNPVCYHWAHAEKSFWKKTTSRFTRPIGTPNWYDLCELFKNEPITVKGCLGFGLKTIATQMMEYGMIKSKWDKNELTCLSGTDAIVAVWEAENLSKKRGIPLTATAEVKDIVEYNKIDVKVLQEILKYIRKNMVPQ